MKLKDIVSYLDSAIPLAFQESYDNSGLQVGEPDQAVTSALITLDVTEKVVEEAISEGCNLILSHHPVIFNSLKRISAKTATERIITRAIRKNISIYSLHTNLDVSAGGVSKKIAQKLGLINIKALRTLKDRLYKLVTYVPEDHLDKVRKAVFEAGAGVLGNYDYCGFVAEGTGSFRAGEDTDPFVGEKGKLNFEKEARFETVLYSHLRDKVIRALLEAHPYEEVAYDLYSLENDNIKEGLGCTGELPEPVKEADFLRLVKKFFEAKGVRYSEPSGKHIARVAVCGGAGADLLRDAIAAGADAFITADIKYHTFQEAGNRILLVDCGHYETEKYSEEIIYDLLVKKFPKFALRFSKTNTNPINYL
jgi:dinuclear metal center YbgI/SA1388 family protein